MTYQSTPDFAKAQDQKDPLSRFRKEYHIPKKNNKEVIYFCGNSLGLQPKRTEAFIQKELQSWKEQAVEGHFSGDQPWAEYHRFSKKSLGRLVGGLEDEVVSMNNLTTNLHLLLASFYQPAGKRVKVMIENGAFPSDHYAVESHMEHLGVNPKEHLILLSPADGKTFRNEEITQAIRQHGDELALVLFPGVQYYSGQYFDMKAISEAAHQVGAFAGFDLAHAMGNLPMNLHDDNIDFAAWCSYKYLNSGPGGVSGIFIHQRHCADPQFPKLKGWWGHDHNTRFNMDNQFVPNPGVDAWMLSNSNVISTAAHHASLELFDEAGMEALRKKSLSLTGYLEYLLLSDDLISRNIDILTPKEPESRGCQLSVFISKNGKEIYDGLIAQGVILDWREPNVIRVAPTPMYNTFNDVYEFCQILKALIIIYGA